MDKKGYLPYNKNLKEFSRYLRKNSTLAEVLLWNELKSSKMKGCKFNRQRPLGVYIVDFYCKSKSLIIEIDGISHGSKIEKDAVRQSALEEMGLKILRFKDEEVKDDLSKVLKKIEEYIDEYDRNRIPLPPFRRGTKTKAKYGHPTNPVLH